MRYYCVCAALPFGFPHLTLWLSCKQDKWALGEVNLGTTHPGSEADADVENDDTFSEVLLLEPQRTNATTLIAGVELLVSLLGGRAWAFHHSVLQQSDPNTDGFFNTSGPPFSSDAEWIRQWMLSSTSSGGMQHAAHIVQRSYVSFRSLTDVHNDGSPFPWLSDIPFPL